MKKHIFLIISLFWLLPLTSLADGVVTGTVTLNGQTIEAEYYIHGSIARLGSGYNACIPQYSIGKVEVPYYIIVGGYPYPVTEISTFAFRRCNRITEVTLSEGVMRIGDFAFAGCPSLQKVTLPSSLSSIGTGAFYQCRGLISFIIGSGVTSIEAMAFTSCEDLTDVYCLAKDVPEAFGAFDESPIEKATLHVLASALNAYRTTEPWSEFGSIVALPEVGGDLNGDGKVDIADAVCVLDVMATDVYDSKADLNEDGKIDIADFVCVLDIMAKQ